eukprot:scaffold6571_cov114-Isochrysis_galbana.AAC.2
MWMIARMASASLQGICYPRGAEELSAPDSYSGSPTSYSWAENTEELSTSDGLRATFTFPNSYRLPF